jgi:hypothetical protein
MSMIMMMMMIMTIGCSGREREAGQSVDPHRPRVGEKSQLLHGSMSGHEVPQVPLRLPLASLLPHLSLTSSRRKLLALIMAGKCEISKAVNVQLISLDEAPKGYEDFDKGPPLGVSSSWLHIC